MSTRENRFRPPGLNEVEETMWPPVGFMKETLSIFDKRFLITPTDKKKMSRRGEQLLTIILITTFRKEGFLRKSSYRDTV